MRLGPALALALALGGCGGDDDAADPDAASADAAAPDARATAPTVFLPKAAITPDEIAVVVNDADAQSVAVAAYYQTQRGIPAGNVVTLSFSTGPNLDPTEFATVKAELDAALGPDIQALALTWAHPYRVGCMSATSAFALGYDTSYCNTSGDACGVTADVDYYDSSSASPFTDHGIRPAMALAAASEQDAFDLIDRGIAADDSFPSGDGYLVRTTDTARSVRWPTFVGTVSLFDHDGGLTLTYIDNSDGAGSNALTDTGDVLFYFTGLAQVPGIDTNTYLPGAVADHLTSFGGQIPSGGQMSVQEWLTAGVTASFGTVVEPCNYEQKFPRTSVMLPHYFRGATVLEAYWKSVQWPGEGLFVGEPLARPWGDTTVEYDAGTLTITTNYLDPRITYELAGAVDEAGPYQPVLEDIRALELERTAIVLDGASLPYYRLSPSE